MIKEVFITGCTVVLESREGKTTVQEDRNIRVRRKIHVNKRAHYNPTSLFQTDHPTSHFADVCETGMR
jgi:hypothetical protein